MFLTLRFKIIEEGRKVLKIKVANTTDNSLLTQVSPTCVHCSSNVSKCNLSRYSLFCVVGGSPLLSPGPSPPPAVSYKTQAVFSASVFPDCAHSRPHAPPLPFLVILLVTLNSISWKCRAHCPLPAEKLGPLHFLNICFSPVLLLSSWWLYLLPTVN